MNNLVKKAGQFHHGNLEEALIIGAINLISETGETNFSLREVSQKIGVSHAAAYRHFSSKAHLLNKIAIRGFQMLKENLLEKTGSSPDSKNPYKLLLSLGEAYIDFGLQNPGIYRALFMRETMNLDINGELAEVSSQSFQPILDAIFAGQKERKIIPTANPIDISNMLWASYHGYIMLCLENDLSTNNKYIGPNLPKMKFLELIHQSIWKK